MGATNKFLEDLNQDIPRDWFWRQFLKQKLLGMIKWVVFRCLLTSMTILITVGATNRILEDLSPDITRD